MPQATSPPRPSAGQQRKLDFTSSGPGDIATSPLIDAPSTAWSPTASAALCSSDRGSWFPDGSSIALDKMPATDAGGYSGLEDGVDFRSWQLIKGIALSTLLGLGTELSLGSSENDLVRAVRESTQQNAAHAGDQITSRNLDVQPTRTVRPGWPVRAIVQKGLVLRPGRDEPMPSIKLRRLPNRSPVKITIALSPELNRALGD
jgi:hypothetical protein